MKRIFNYLLLIAGIALLAAGSSCSETDDSGRLDVSKTELNFTTSIKSLVFNVAGDISWTITTPEWITCSPAQGKGSASVTATATDNPGAERTGSIVVTSGEMKKTISVKQEGVDFSLSQSTFEFDEEGTPLKVTIISKYEWTIDVPEKAAWCRVTPASGGPGETVVTLTPEPITDRTPRGKQLLTINYNKTFSMLTISQKMPNTPPSAPKLLAPVDNAADVSILGKFQWQPSVDPDGDDVTYKLMLSTDNGASWASTSTAETVARFNTLLSKNTNYVWKVEAIDAFNATASSEIAHFTTGEGGAYADGEVVRWQTETAGASQPVQLVLMGDGFIEEDYVEGGAFDQAAEIAFEAFFHAEPFKTYRNFFRTSVVTVYSQERGATVLRDMTGCKAQTRNTAFSATLEGGGSTGTSCDYDKVLSYAKKVSGMNDEVLKNTTVLLIINLDVYAGTCLMYATGQSVSMCPMGKNSFKNVVMHEGGGHGFGRLLDEYRYNNSSLPGDRKAQINSWRGYDPYYGNNISLTNDRNTVHWRHFFTLSGYDAVALYEGACLYAQGVWRPEYISCMEDNRGYFNAPSREAIVRRIRRASGTTFSIDDFISKDVVRHDNSGGGTRAPEMFVPLAPPILIDNLDGK